MLGFIALMVLLRSLRTEDAIARKVRRERWPWPLRVVDGAAAVAFENPLTVLGLALRGGFFLFLAWLAVDFVSFVIQIATGVTAF